MWKTIWDELSEMIFLASLIAGLSAMGVGLAVTFAVALTVLEPAAAESNPIGNWIEGKGATEMETVE